MRRSWILTKLFSCLCFSLALLCGYEYGSALAASTPSSSPPKTQVPAEHPRIVAFGNSLTAGLGVPPDQSYPAHLQRTLDAAGYAYRVVNAGVSGDTTAGGVRRVSWVLNSRPAIVILELGGNDGLRGLSLHETQANLERIVQQLQQASVTVVLAGMKLPPNYGGLSPDCREDLPSAGAVAGEKPVKAVQEEACGTGEGSGSEVRGSRNFGPRFLALHAPRSVALAILFSILPEWRSVTS